jgi:hypothetical protein
MIPQTQLPNGCLKKWRLKMQYPVFRTNKSFFFDNSPPHPHRGWTLKAFQDFCREEMLDAGFDLSRKIQCRYDPRSGNVVFWQEPPEAFDFFPYSEN